MHHGSKMLQHKYSNEESIGGLISCKQRGKTALSNDQNEYERAKGKSVQSIGTHPLFLTGCKQKNPTQ